MRVPKKAYNVLMENKLRRLPSVEKVLNEPAIKNLEDAGEIIYDPKSKLYERKEENS